MPRKPLSPDKLRANCARHAADAVAAAATLASADATPAERLAAAKTLESAGCYIRRALAKGAS